MSTQAQLSSVHPHARALARWAAMLEFEHLPESTVAQIKLSVLDGLGCAIYAYPLPSTQAAIRAMACARMPSGGASIWGTGARYEPMAAAMVNGAALQGFELDDVHGEAMLHGTSAMLPALMAIADVKPAISGARLITALAAGWEAGTRLSRCMGPHILARGWHAPTIFGTVAAAAAVGRAMAFDEQKMMQCLMLGVLQASGLLVVQYEGMTKRLYAGCAAKGGVLAGLLAESGFTAPEDALGHPVGGFISTFAGGDPVFPEALSEGLGREFAASTIAFKLHANCAAMHPALDALAELRAAHPKIAPDTIDSITVRLTEHSYKHVGWNYVPGSATTAQFSVAYSMAALLLEGAAFVEQYRPDLLADETVLRLVARIEAVHDPLLETNRLGARHRCHVTVRLKSGEVFEKSRETARGKPDDPVPANVIADKFRRLTAERMAANQRENLFANVQRLEALADVRLMGEALAGPMAA